MHTIKHFHNICVYKVLTKSIKMFQNKPVLWLFCAVKQYKYISNTQYISSINLFGEVGEDMLCP